MRRLFCGKGYGCGAWMAMLGATGVFADGLDQPLVMVDRSPLVQVHGLPAARNGDVLAPMQMEWRLGYDVASNFVDQAQDAERVQLDGETRRLELNGRVGLGRDWEVGFTLPYLEQTGGSFDSLIEGWHKFWGLPDGGRPQMVRNRLYYNYLRDGETVLDFQRAESGIGDLQLSGAYRLWHANAASAALQVTAKLPTGDAARLTGDDATAIDLTLAVSTADLWGTDLRAYANAGKLWLQRGDVLADIQNDSVWHVAAGLGWRACDYLELKMQLETHSAFYRSDLRALGTQSVLLVVGGSARLSPHWLLDVGFGEDLRVDTAPDAVLQLALRWQP